MLFRKKIILGITGSIAAYKSALLARQLIKAGAEVRVIMSESAKDFITPLTLHTLTKNPVNQSFTVGEQGEWVNHVELGLWADAILIAPASANTLSHCAAGICDSLLIAVYLSARCPVFFAPAMDVDMWNHPSTKSNVRTLQTYGNHIIAPGTGELASGLIGEGRMSEPEEIVDFLEDYYSSARLMRGKKILISAGPTIEPIDDVRFISNHSSGKMGYAIASELASRGAEITLVSGPVNNLNIHPAVRIIHVRTADEMYDACLNVFPEQDAAIMTAAVADFKPEATYAGKIKKDETPLEIKLRHNKDILKELGSVKTEDQILIGFALETSEGKNNAAIKIKNKNLNMIVLNLFDQQNQVFGSDVNHVSFGFADGKWKD
ncbi:MAG: bifunctional phosphopantothenoylcysteine decarboxylase/phosphopantothenate--cysteine ligase CoaBC, partial [Bacteroidetes bacterium]|nr:bifunctional phosphopantothenoylcysteine decarboxylase/phosphopantothenate--cysteine ligase CoaBC [Bacteroidota bacterium]